MELIYSTEGFAATLLSDAKPRSEQVLLSQGRIVGITAEAGMGKSRLVAGVIRLARRRDLVGYGGSCESYGTHTPYLVWAPIWRAFFDVDPAADQRGVARPQGPRCDIGSVEAP